MKEKQTLEEFINSQPYYGHGTPEYLEGIEVGAKWQQEQELDRLKEALEIIRKFVNEFDEEGEVSYNTRDEAEIFLTKQQEQ
jgi:hypothetical protein